MKKKKENIENQDPNLEKIRHYRGTWDNFFDFWKSKGVEVDPYKGTILKYPTEKIYKGRENVHQDFDTYKKSKTIKENMKHILTYEEFVNESQIINEARNSNQDSKIKKFMREFLQDSVKSLGFGYKGDRAMYNADMETYNGHDMKDLEADHFAIIPYADGDYWNKRHLKKVGPMFAQDLQSSQNDYNVEFVEVNKKSPEVILKITKK